MKFADFEALAAELSEIRVESSVGRVSEVTKNTVKITGLSDIASVGDLVKIHSEGGEIAGELLVTTPESSTALLDAAASGVVIGDRVIFRGPQLVSPAENWIGRVIDPAGNPLDGFKLTNGPRKKHLLNLPPKSTERKLLGERLDTGLCIFDTLLPIVRGQRLGIFSGSGVGKSTLLASLAKGINADVVVIAMIGERGREVREFIDNVLGPEGMSKTILVAATSDQSPLSRRNCIYSAMTVAEHFRDLGLHVLLLADSITRFAEAHREVALAGGETASLRGFPPSLSQAVMGLCERAGPGRDGQGDITAIFTVLVAGSDMEEPIADLIRGVLDGHIVLDREIAERGRFPAVSFLKSVSRSLPHAANEEENALITQTRQLLGAYDRSEIMIQSGLYVKGTDPVVDKAISAFPALDQFQSEQNPEGVAASFEKLRSCLPDS